MQNVLIIRRRGILSLFFVILISASSLLAQNQYNVSQFTHESLDFVKQPGKWHGNDWLRLGLVTSTTALVMSFDQPIRDAVLSGNRKYYHSVPVVAGRVWGEWYTPPILISAFALHGILAHDNSTKKVSFEMLQAVVYAEGVTQSLKFVFGRARPFENQGAFSYHPFQLSDMGLHSLPGGHNTNGWAMSTVLSRNVHSKTLKVLAFLPAALTFFSRVYQDQHWSSDDFLGASIGYFVGTWVVNTHERKESAVNISGTLPFTISISF